MGLDLSVREQTNFSVVNGRNTWQVTELANLRNCWNTLELLDIENCATKSFLGNELHDILQELKDGYNLMNDRGVIEADMLQALIDENNIPNDDSKSYEIHAWY